MKPISFEGQNTVFAENQEPYLPLPAFKHSDDWLCVSSLWKLSVFERVRLLFTGKIWATMPTFGNALTPLRLGLDCPIPKESK